MTGEITTCRGETVRLPAFVQWNIRRTDGDPCDAFAVQFPLDASMTQKLREAVTFTARQARQTVFCGVVDDLELRQDAKGLVAELTGRGMGAKLLDTQVRAAEYASAQLEDILRSYVRACDITKIEAEAMPPVSSFVVETGYTCWQVLAGFCRHSAGIRPRFSADGTLILKRKSGGTVQEVTCGMVKLGYEQNRYDAVSEQTIINTRTGQQETARNAQVRTLGGFSRKMTGRSGSKIRATWRTAQQRVEDAARQFRIVRVQLPGSFLAEPLDIVRLSAPEMDISGVYTVTEAESCCDDTGESCTLTMRE